ncbi:aromatic ring-hydroxylating dioxygenase subunit alpha [Lacisediminimonas sp.]|uniref:aromatic ring-hydroxylating oxygenase subunit alpha n=1 Tax=Lacisediminimonas sp. TaxID=3060582 RepID=UPI00272389D6|nr:aromatic ring-hydroxylating dioxygenase subunit alpha [Lacisediminimonas sp.]MDO8300181.1 aromatic ring-hydroxylating dioxygenase subunit alpha [Lacisediminimonas sp.]
MDDPIFSPALYESTRRPLHEASPMPGACYVSPQWYEREMETMFRKDWLCVGRAEQIPAVGDHFSIEIIGQPMIVVRDENNEIKVHSALCRHRGAIITESAGRTRAFVCPYHSWTYSLSGKLVSTPGTPPPFAGVAGFKMADHGLNAIRSEIWGGFIFINFDQNAVPLIEWLGDLPDFLAAYNLQDMQWTHRDMYEIDCNWKVWLENAFENYHVPTIHRDHYDPANPQNWMFEKTQGPWEAMSSKRSIVAYSGLPVMPGLDEQQEKKLFHIWIQPSLQIILTSSYMKFRQYLPLGPEKLRLYENWTFPKTTVARPDFGDIVGPAYYEKYSQVVREDIGINPNIQRAMRSGSYTPGRYSLEEHIVHRIATRVIDRVVGPDDKKAKA